MSKAVGTIATVVLVARLSRQMGAGNKLLLPLPGGSTVLISTLRQVLACLAKANVWGRDSSVTKAEVQRRYTQRNKP
jgi:CTP:molybdopterin cytidylyltransferase MocA